jgi:hypothetical protein
MDRQRFLRERLSLSPGPGWEGEILFRNDDGSVRLATPKEIREAAEFMPWVQEWLKKNPLEEG